MPNYKYQPLTSQHLNFLKEMFYTSLFVPEGADPFPLTIIEQPNLKKYWENWGGATDSGIIVLNKDEAIGAVWCRFFTEENAGYGFVNTDSPELGIAIKENYRGQGIGGILLQKMFEALNNRQVPSVSLSVSADNPALKLYQRHGFEIIKKEGTAYTMLKKLEN